MPPMKQETVRVTLYLPPTLKAKLEREAKHEHRSVNSLIVSRLSASLSESPTP